MSKLTEIKTCPTCDSPHITWDIGKRSGGGIADGRLRIHDIAVELYLGCETCSETIRILREDEALCSINSLLKEAVCLNSPVLSAISLH